MSGTVQFIIRVKATYPLAIPHFATSQDEMNRKMSAAINTVALSQGDLPVGFMLPIAMDTLPNGWLFCDGSLISRVQFPALFDAIGIKFGAGDGANTFGLPDTRVTGPVAAATTPATTIDAGGSVSMPAPTPTTPGAPPTTPAPTGNPGQSGGNVSSGGRDGSGANRDGFVQRNVDGG